MTHGAHTRQADIHRLTVRVPLVDSTTLIWWSAQHDVSASIRALIREDVKTNGVTDTVNRPIITAASLGATGTDRQREAPDPGHVREFWNLFSERFAWGLLPYTFLTDLYKAWFAKTHPQAEPVGRNTFMKLLRDSVSVSSGWAATRAQNETISAAGRMSADEPLIREYQLARWFNHSPRCAAAPCCNRGSHRGVYRTENPATEAKRRDAAARIAQLEIELLDLRETLTSRA